MWALTPAGTIICRGSIDFPLSISTCTSAYVSWRRRLPAWVILIASGYISIKPGTPISRVDVFLGASSISIAKYSVAIFPK